MRTKNAYDNNIIAINGDPNLPHLYGIKENSVLNDLNYFHVADGLPPDLGHDLFGGFTVDIVSNCLFYSWGSVWFKWFKWNHFEFCLQWKWQKSWATTCEGKATKLPKSQTNSMWNVDFN